MRRIDKLRTMSTEDVAKYMWTSDILQRVPYCKNCNIPYRDITSKDCLACVVKWLEEEEEKHD